MERRKQLHWSLLPLTLLFLAACRGTPASPTATSILERTHWKLISLNGKDLLEATYITLEFSGGFVSGDAGCNNYKPLILGTDPDKYKYRATDDGILTIPGFMYTELLCPTPEGIMEQEEAYLDSLRDAAAYRVMNDRLEIDNAAGETTLVFKKQEQYPAQG